MGSGHRLAEERSLALHRAVVERLRQSPDLLEGARARVRAWRADGRMHARWADAWERVLERPLEEVCAVLTDPGEEACALRQSTPFTSILDARARWRIWRTVRAEKASLP